VKDRRDPGVRVQEARIEEGGEGTLDVGNAIILIAALSFIGLGAIAPAPQWGVMIAAGQAKFAGGAPGRSA
jgi:hypothetical protein